jgi:F-box-like
MTRHDCLAYFPASQGRSQDTAERLPNFKLTIINRLPDEVFLEIFDFYRQGTIHQYDHQWRKKYAWFNLAHVCRRWRAVMFASSSRLDLNIIVGPDKPGQIKTILSGHLPILIDHSEPYGPSEMPGIGSALWRMRAALASEHRDRVREISISFKFRGCDGIFNKYIRATTNYHFPALESLVLYFPQVHKYDIPATFLRGPDRSDLLLRRLGLYDAFLASVSGLLLSATALTDLTLSVNAADFVPSQGSFLLSCLQGMQCLRNLDLTTSYDFDFQSQFQLQLPKIVLSHY